MNEQDSDNQNHDLAKKRLEPSVFNESTFNNSTETIVISDQDTSFEESCNDCSRRDIDIVIHHDFTNIQDTSNANDSSRINIGDVLQIDELTLECNSLNDKNSSRKNSATTSQKFGSDVDNSININNNDRRNSNVLSNNKSPTRRNSLNTNSNSRNSIDIPVNHGSPNSSNTINPTGVGGRNDVKINEEISGSSLNSNSNNQRNPTDILQNNDSTNKNNTVNASKNSERNSDIAFENDTSQARYNILGSNINRTLENINMLPNVVITPLDISNIPSTAALQKKITASNKRISSDISHSTQEKKHKLLKVDSEAFNIVQINQLHVQQQSTNQPKNEAAASSNESGEKIQNDSIRQLKSVLLVLHGRLRNNFQVSLITDVPEPKYLSDAVFCFEKIQSIHGEIDCTLFKVKYIMSNESNPFPKINYRTLSSPDFNITEYYRQYLAYAKNLSCQQNNKKITKIILYSNLELNIPTFENNDITIRQIDEDKYKLVANEKSRIFKVLLEKSSDLPILAKLIADHINTGNTVILKGILKKYHMALVIENVIKIKILGGSSDNKRKQKIFGEFHRNFIEGRGMTEAAKELRQLLVKYLGRQLCETMKLVVNRNFGEDFIFENNPEVSNIDKLATELTTVISSSLAMPTEKISFRRNPSLKDDLRKITVHILEKGINDSVVFSKNFLNYSVDLPGNLNLLRDIIKIKLTTKNIDFSDIGLCKFKINEFRDKETIGVMKQLPSGDNRKFVKDFLAKLVFVVNKQDVDYLIRKAIGEEFELIQDKTSAINIQNELFKWFRSNKEGVDPFTLIKRKISKTIVTNRSVNRCKFPETIIDFKPEVLIEIRNGLLDITDHFMVFKSNCVCLTILKISQVTKSIPEYSDNDQCMLIKSNILSDMPDHVIKAFESQCTKLLVFEFDRNWVKIENISDTVKTLRNIAAQQGEMKKLLLVINHLQFTEDSHEKYPIMTDMCRLSDVTKESQVKLLEKIVVKIHSRRMRLKDFLDVNMLSKLIRTSQLLTQIINDNIVIGEQIIAPSNFDDDCYIPACIKRLVIINPEIFRDSIDDIFVISDIEKAELFKLLPPRQKICHIYELDLDVRTEVRFILLSGAESKLGFDNITRKNSTKNIHLLRYESRAFVWQQSSGSIAALVKYKAEEIDYLQQPKVLQDILADGSAGEKIIIVSGETGVGKSVYLHKLAERSLAASASALNPLWVVQLELSNEIMQDHEHRVFRDNAEAVHFFTRLLNYDTLGQNLFALSANGKMHLRLALFLDGYDELRREYADVAGNLINQLRNTNIERIYVTAGPSSASSLETKLNTFSYELCPLNNENRMDYLVKYWRKSVESCPETSLHEYARRLLDNHGSVDRTIDLTSSPQQLKMLAQIYSRYLGNTGHEYTTVHLQDQHDLYKRYVEMEGRWDDWSKLQTAALRRLLTPTEQHYLGLPERSKNDVDELPSVFCHWTFIEYFAANYLWQKSRSGGDQEATILRCCDGLVEDTSPVFLSTLMSLFRLDSQDSLAHFDQLLARYGHVRFLRALPKTQLNNYGLGDQTALHQAAEAGQLETVRLLLERHNDTGAREVLVHGEFARAEYAESSLVKFINKQTRQGKSAVQLTRKVDVACELALMGADLSHVDTLVLQKMALHAATDALQGGRLQHVAEKLLRLSPRAANELNREDQYPKLLAYFFARGRVEMIERLLEVLGDETERYRLLEAGGCNATFLDHVNCSSTLRDEERLEVTRFLVDKIGWSLGKKDKLYLWSVLHAAARQQHVSTFDFFIGQYPRQHAGFLERCLLTNELETIEFLLRNRERTVDPKTGDPALHTAVRLGASLRIIRVLVDKDGVNNINNDGENALCVAIKTGQNLSLIEYLMDKGANPTTEDKQSLYPWCYAILEEKSKYSNEQQHEIMRYFLRKSNGRMPRLLAHDKSYSYGKWRLEIERKLEFFESIDSYSLLRADSDDQPRLHRAIRSGELAWCRFLVAQQSADVNARDMQQGCTALHVACVCRRYDLARYLLQNGASFDATDLSGRTALQLAEDDADMRALLKRATELFSSGKKLKDEVSVEKSKWSKSPLRYLLGCKNKEARTLLHVAADTNTRLRALIKFGEEINEKYPDCKLPDVNARDSDGDTPMHLAASKGYKNCVLDLVDEGARYNAENNAGKTPRDLATETGHKGTADLLGLIDKMFLAVKARKLADIKSCLSQEKKLVNARNSLGQSILHLACGFASIDIVNYLVSASNARIAGVDLGLKTPLHYAAESDSEACVEALLRAGAPLDARDRQDRRPLDLGDPRRSRAIQLLQTLHELFADLLSDEPRIFASEERIAERLKYVSVAPSTRDRAKNTLLHHAVRLHYLPAARALLRLGAAYNSNNAQRKAPVDLIRAGVGVDSELLRLLSSVAKLFRHQDVESWDKSGVEKEIIIRCRKAGGYTLLHNAAKEKKKLELKWLLSMGADPEAVDNKGRGVEMYDVSQS